MNDIKNEHEFLYSPEDSNKIKQLEKRVLELRHNYLSNYNKCYNDFHNLFLLYFTYGNYKMAVRVFQGYIDFVMEIYDIKELGLLCLLEDLEEQEIYCLINAFMSLGAAYMYDENLQKAQFNFDIGYFLSALSYGDENEITLRFCMNLALLKFCYDTDEGKRELQYVYDDMKQYLGSNSNYTKFVKRVLSKVIAPIDVHS